MEFDIVDWTLRLSMEFDIAGLEAPLRRRWSSTLLTDMETGELPWTSVERSSSEQDFVQLVDGSSTLWNSGKRARSNVHIAELLNERRRLNVELKKTAGYRAGRSRRTRYETVRLLSSAEWSNQTEVCGSS